jgi:two-component system response regulator GlrR
MPYKAIDEALEQRSPATDEAWRQAIVTRSPLMLRLLSRPGWWRNRMSAY